MNISPEGKVRRLCDTTAISYDAMMVQEIRLPLSLHGVIRWMN